MRRVLAIALLVVGVWFVSVAAATEGDQLLFAFIGGGALGLFAGMAVER